jgi:hypothetical protein
LALRLFLDEDVGPAVAYLLREHEAFDVLTTPEAGRANRSFSDEAQLEFAAADNRTIFSHNIKHYEPLAVHWATERRHHSGILLAPQWRPTALLQGFLELHGLYPDGLPPDLCMRLPRARD